MELGDLHLVDGEALAHGRALTVRDNTPDWFALGEPQLAPLSALDVILMRKDPPVDMEYVYASHILERAEAAGALVVNKPASLRDANEKLYTAWFPQCCPPTLVSRKGSEILKFLAEQADIIVKPLGAMGGGGSWGSGSMVSSSAPVSTPRCRRSPPRSRKRWTSPPSGLPQARTVSPVRADRPSALRC